MDAGTKEILAQAMSPSLELDFVLETVEMLMDKHGSELNRRSAAFRPRKPLQHPFHQGSLPHQG